MTTGMKMAEPNCTAQPTATQQQAAVNLVDQTAAAAQKYTSLAAAKAAGYVPVTPSGARIVHYINPTIYRSGQALNPDAIPCVGLREHGSRCGALGRHVPGSQGPDAATAGWLPDHSGTSTPTCASPGAASWATTPTPRAAPGALNRVTQPMMHVWMTPVTGGPLAPDPPALNEVEAAVEDADAQPSERDGP